MKFVCARVGDCARLRPDIQATAPDNTSSSGFNLAYVATLVRSFFHKAGLYFSPCSSNVSSGFSF